MKEYLSIKEACKEFGISRSAMYRLINSGAIKKYRLGMIAKRTFISRSEIEALFKPVQDSYFIKMAIEAETIRRSGLRGIDDPQPARKYPNSF